MKQYLFPIVCIIAGGFFLSRNFNYMRNEEKLRSYLEINPKAKLWVSKLGLEKTVVLSKKIFLPLGCLVAAALLGTGIVSFSLIFLNT